MIRLNVNGAEHQVDADPEMPLLWALRDVLGLTGHQVRLRHGPVRRLHRARRRRGQALVRHARSARSRAAR